MMYRVTWTEEDQFTGLCSSKFADFDNVFDAASFVYGSYADVSNMTIDRLQGEGTEPCG